jgi:hypothetical protein
MRKKERKKERIKEIFFFVNFGASELGSLNPS